MSDLNQDKRILVVGAGAVGAYVGGHLSCHGFDVTLADPWPEHIAAIREGGLKLEGTTAEEAVTAYPRVMHLTDLQSLNREAPFHNVLLSVKSYDTDWAAHLAALYLAEDGYVVSLQNAINEHRIADVVGVERTLGCIASKIVVELVSPGHVIRGVAKGGAKHTVFRVGEYDGSMSDRAAALANALSHIDSAKATENLAGERWTKLVQNAMSNCVSAATGLPVKAYLNEERARRVSIRLAGEAVAVGLSLGYQLELINGLPGADWVTAGEALASGANQSEVLARVEEKLLAGAASMSDGARPSMAQDIGKGRRTEINELNGEVVRRSWEKGIETPFNAAMQSAVQQVEQGAVDPGLDLLPMP